MFFGITCLENIRNEMKKIEFKNFDKYALVTGAASGMGRVYSQRLAGMGYNLVIVDINAAGLEETGKIVKAQVEAMPELAAGVKSRFKVLVVAQDLSVMEAADRVFERTEAEGCEVEVLVNNAGIMFYAGVDCTSEKMLSRIMMVHMYTSLMLCRKYIGPMKERGNGYILNISSLAAWMNWPAIGMYGNTKRFVKDYSRELRIEAQKTGVSVTNAYFGAVDTPLIKLKPSLRRLAHNLGVMIYPEKAVDSALNATFRRRKGAMPGLCNHIFKPVVRILPDRLLGRVYRMALKRDWLMHV